MTALSTACLRKSSRYGPRRQQLCKTEFVPVRISDTKEALAPGRISGRVGRQSLYPQRPMKYVRVIDAENSATPPAMLISRTRNQIDEGGTTFQTAELGALTAVDWLKAKLSVECN